MFGQQTRCYGDINLSLHVELVVRISMSHIAAAKSIATKARSELPRAILEASGRALYSPATTLTSGSSIYFLGLNPGEFSGPAEFHDLLTVQGDLERLESDKIELHGFRPCKRMN